MPSLPAYQTKPQPKAAPITSLGEVIDASAALRNCEEGKSFVVDSDTFRQRIIGYAKRLGITIKTKRNESGRYDIWRTA